MKNSIAKVIKFMRTVVEESPNIRYSMKQDTSGRAVFLDHTNLVEVRVGVEEIIINRYANTKDQKLVDTATILWDELSMRNKTEIIEIMDDVGDGESDERDEIIERIFQ